MKSTGMHYNSLLERSMNFKDVKRSMDGKSKTLNSLEQEKFTPQKYW